MRQSPAGEESEACVDAVKINHMQHPQNPRRSLGSRTWVGVPLRRTRLEAPAPPPLLSDRSKRVTKGASSGTMLSLGVSPADSAEPVEGGHDPRPQYTQSDPAAFPASRLREGRGGDRLKVKGILLLLPPNIPKHTQTSQRSPDARLALLGGDPAELRDPIPSAERKSRPFTGFQEELPLGSAEATVNFRQP